MGRPMTDDIVTRLRHWANAPLKSQMIETTLAEAADEIERLRAELKDANDDFNAMREMFLKMRANRDGWRDGWRNQTTQQ